MKQNHSIRTLLALATAIVVGACGGGGGGDSTQAPPPPSLTGVLGASETVTETGIVTGTVRDPSNATIGGATVKAGSLNATANEQGFFLLEKVPPGTDVVVATSKSGYVAGSVQIDVLGGQHTHVDVTLRRVGATRTAVPGGTAANLIDARSDGRNGRVSIPANAVVDASGRPVSTYTAEITTMLPSDTGYTASFPGRFLGGSTPGSTANPVPLVSYGVIEVDLKDGQGRPLTLAPGIRATLTFPVDPNAAHDPGTATVPLWYLDRNSGIWIQEGVATRSGSTYVAQVDHFSAWNLDVGFSNVAWKDVYVRGLNGVPVANARIFVQGTGYRQIANTGADGRVRIPVLAGDTIRVWAQRGTLVSPVVTETAPGNGITFLNEIDLIDPQVTAILSWGRSPDDLDAHLTGPGALHVWWAAKGSAITAPFAKLDTDDMSGFGPEIVTLTKLDAGTYRYSVHNYSGQAAGPLQASGAVVNLVVARTGTIRRYDVPAANPANGNLWVVFELDVNAAGSVAVRDVQAMRNTDNAQLVP